MMNSYLDENDNCDAVFLENNNNIKDGGAAHSDEFHQEARPCTPPVGLDEKALEVLRGSLTNLPKMSTNTIRIFLSSTFSDFKAERNVLHKRAYPILQEYCSEIGLDFQVVDMRWGVTDDVINDHQVSQLCIQEILTCQEISCGPNFVMFLGNRYGYQPFPNQIEASLFEKFIEVAENHWFEHRSLLHTWFRKDENAEPVHYRLKPIHSELKYYNSMEPEFSTEREAAKQEWAVVFGRLRVLLRMCASQAREEGVITPEDEKEYYISVTEQEIQQGLFSNENAHQKVLCYTRELLDIETDTASPETARYVDLVEDQQLDEAAQTLRQDLIKRRIPDALPAENLRLYQLQWKGTPLEDDGSFDTELYLDRFSDEFIEDMKRLINLTRNDVEDHEYQRLNLLHQEILHHARFAMAKCERFCGRQDEMHVIRNYLSPQACEGGRLCVTSPFVVIGSSGFGKTALLAKVAQHITTWLGPNAVVILRFLGTSPQSSIICDVLRTIILQICVSYNFPLPGDEYLESIGDVRRQFWNLLDQTSKTCPSQPLVIILDSVDQLRYSFGAHGMKWLPKTLPSNVFIVISMLSDRFTCYENTMKRYKVETNYLPLSELPVETGVQICKTFLSQNHRRITKEQQDLVTWAFCQNRQPLFLKLLLDDAKLWHSYTPVSDIVITGTVHEAITKLFEAREITYGRTFVRHALGYLTCGVGGLTSVEMEDALSCDDEVLNEVYQYHDPPREGIIRIPSLLWARLQNSLSEYLTDRQVDEKAVHAWYHRQFWEAAEQRYLATQAQRQKLHGILADIFIHGQGIRKTIVLKQRSDKPIEDANRCVTPQPLSARNRRKLNSLPHHLLEANRIELLKETCMLNFSWLLISLLAFNVGAVAKKYANFCDSEAMNDRRTHTDVHMFKDLLELCFDALWQDPFLLAFNIIERMHKCKEVPGLLSKLLAQAESWIKETNNPTLVPTHRLNLPSPDSPLKFNVLVGYEGIVTYDEKMIVCNWKERTGLSKIQVLDLQTKDIIASVPTEKPLPFQLTRDNIHIVYCDSSQLKMLEMDGGDVVKDFQYNETEIRKISVRSMALSDSNKQVALCARYTSKQFQKDWQSEVWVFLLDLESESVYRRVRLECRKLLDCLYYVNNDQFLVAVGRDRLIVYNTESLEIVHQFDAKYELCVNTLTLIRPRNLLVTMFATGAEVQILCYDYMRQVYSFSENIHPAGIARPKPFGIFSDESSDLVTAGTFSMDPENPVASMALWNIVTGEVSKISITPQGSQSPSNLTVQADWSHAFVGWNGGHITVIDLRHSRELWTLQGQGQAMNSMKILSSGMMMTLASDHSLKMWDVARLVEMAHHVADTRMLLKRSNAVIEVPVLDETEPCLDVCVNAAWAVSAPQETYHGPRFWDLGTGELLEELTENHRLVYEQSCADNNITLLPKTHAQVTCIGDMLLYWRMLRNSLSVMVTEGPRALVRAHRAFEDTYFYLIPPPGVLELNPDGSKTRKVILVREVAVEVYHLPTLQLSQSIETKSILQDVRNARSGGGKKRLFSYKIGITYDGKYFIIVNPGGMFGDKNIKLLDIIDLEAGIFVKRVKLPKNVPLTLMDGTVTFLAIATDDFPMIFNPSKLQEHQQKVDLAYVCPLYTGSYVSKDCRLGVQLLNRDHHALVWRLNPLRLLHTMKGHVHRVTSCDFTSDGRYLVTGSYDKTVRVWSVEKGKQVCMFHTNGVVDKVIVNPTDTFVVAHCYSGPQRKKGIILKLSNLKGSRKFSRYFSRCDL